MAYGLKYSANTYTKKHKQGITLNLYQDNYIGSVEPLTVSSWELRVKGQYIKTTSLDLEFYNTSDYNNYDDLLKNYEKEWKIIIHKKGDSNDIYFEGYMLVDIQEQELLSNSNISITFSDYLKKLKDIEIDLNPDDQRRHSFFDIIYSGCTKLSYLRSESTHYPKPFYINSELFYSGHSKTNQSTLYEQTYLYDDFTFNNLVERKNYWEVIEQILKSTGVVLYYYKDAYYIERYNNISGNTNWVYISNSKVFSSCISKEQTYNMQDDFYYLNKSQRQGYESGLATFQLDLDFEEFISKVDQIRETPDVYDMDETSNHLWFYLHPEDGDLVLDTWYIASGCTVNEVDINKYGMTYYIDYLQNTEQYKKELESGLLYKTWVSLPYGKSPKLKIKYKNYLIDSQVYDPDEIKYIARFAIEVITSNPTYNKKYIMENDSGEIFLEDVNMYDDRHIWHIEYTEENLEGRLLEISKTIELEDIVQYLDNDVKLIFHFYPTFFDDLSTDRIAERQIVGDFEVKIEEDKDDNQYNYTINTGFVKKEDDDLQLIDINSYNFQNAVMYSGGTTGEGWTDDNGSSHFSLADHFVRKITSYKHKTRATLSGDILFKNNHTWMKPLTLISDNNIPNIQFIVDEYSVNQDAIYSIQAKEYSQDTITIN